MDEDTLAEAVASVSLDGDAVHEHVNARVDSPRLRCETEPVSVVEEEGYTSDSSLPALLSSSDMSDDE